ncbi:MAG: CHAT domain-containing protein [Blastocatellales bacterium]
MPTINDHLTVELILALRREDCPAEERLRIEEHCFQCAECREIASLVLLSLSRESKIDREPEFASMLETGVEVANRLRRSAVSETGGAAAENDSPVEDGSPNDITKPGPGGLWRFLMRPKPLMPYAVAAMMLLALACIGYFFWWGKQPVERGLRAIQDVWTDSRPLEARVSGGFPYLPYKVTRGAEAKIAINKKLLVAAEAELSRDAAVEPTAGAQHALGRLYLLKSEFDNAQEQFDLALKDENRNAALLVDLSALYYERGMRDQSAILLGKAAEYCQNAIKLSPRMSEAWFNLALCQEQRLLLTESRNAWEKYLELDPSSKWAVEARMRLQKLRERASIASPSAETLAGDLSSAHQSGDEARIKSLLTEHFVEAAALASGRFLDNYLNALSAGDRASAEKIQSLLQRVARFSEEVKGDHYLSDMVRFLAAADASVIGKVKAVRGLLRQAEQHQRNGDYKKALSIYAEASRAADQIGDVCHNEAALYGSASIYVPQLETPDRQALRESLISDTARRRHRQLHAKALLGIANHYDGAQLISKELEAGLKAYDIAHELGDFDTAVNSLRFVGAAYSRLGDNGTAVEKDFEALQLLFSRKMNPYRACQVYVRIAEAFARGGHSSSALEYQLEGFQYCDSPSSPNLSAMARGRAGFYYSQVGKPEDAVREMGGAISRAQKLNDQAGRDFLLTELQISLGYIFLRQTRYGEADEAFRTALDLASRTDHFRYLSAIHEGMATAYREQRHYEEAEKALEESVELAERARSNINNSRGRSSFLSGRMSVYRTMMDFQYSIKNRPDSAFNYAEICRSRELLDALGETPEFRCRRNQSTLECQGAVRPLTLRQVQRALPPNTQVLEYAITERGLLIWLITSTSHFPKSVPITPSKLQQMVAEYLNELNDRSDLSVTNARAGELYKLLIEPVADLLDKERALVIVPDGVLCAVPFSALFHPSSSRYLLEDYTISFSPSSSVFVRTLALGRTKFKKSSDSLLVLSNPIFDYKRHPSLKPLRKSQEEAEKLKRLYPTSLHLYGQQATKQALLDKAGGYDIVHLATHSLINERNSLLSSIILSVPDTAESSPDAVQSEADLSAYEIFGLRLTRTRLVILSSCKSGLIIQPLQNGLGGLAHAFFSARVPSVIASLWDVDDESTSELMGAFHQFHRVEKKSFSQALRQAQLQLMKSSDEKWQRPFYWAAFMLSGDGFTA